MTTLSALHFSTAAWIAALLGALTLGMGKGGLTGLSILPVIFFASALPPRESTGLVLPLLVVGDICAVITYRRDVVWKVFLLLMPTALLGVVIGFFCMNLISAATFGPLIGWIVMALIAVQLVRAFFGARLDHLFHSRLFGFFMGILAGVTTMIANAAGPVATLYFLSIRLPKLHLIGTMAWLFFAINCCKVPFSAHLGLINAYSLRLSLTLAPLVLAGFFCGKLLAARMPEKVFDWFLLACTFAGALRLVW